MEISESGNLENNCRVCLQYSSPDLTLDCTTIYDEDEQLSYNDCFQICTGIELTNCPKNEPQKLCKNCGLELQITYDFLKKVNESKDLIQNMVSNALLNSTYESKPKMPEQLEDDGNPVSERLLVVSNEEYQEEEQNNSELTFDYSDDNDNRILLEDEVFEGVETSNDEDVVNVKLVNTEYLSTTNNLSNDILVVDNASLSNSDVCTGDEYCLDNTDELNTEILEELEEQYDDEEDEDEVDESQNENVSITISPMETRKCRQPSGQYPCTDCSKVFRLHSRLLTHQRIHDANRQRFDCAYCDRVYATKQACDVHIRTAHDKTGKICEICGKNFAISKLLEVHMRYHRGEFPFECYQCDRKFAQSNHLKMHIRVKHESARFMCKHENCNKLFTSSASLRSHEFLHSGMPFECTICKRGYPTKAKLKIHVRVKHNKEMTSDELEFMRKFHITRSKPNLVQCMKLD